jgi:hypothetical protein
LEIDEDSDVGEEDIQEEEEDLEGELMLDRKVFRRNRSANKLVSKNPDEEEFNQKKKSNQPII